MHFHAPQEKFLSNGGNNLDVVRWMRFPYHTHDRYGVGKCAFISIDNKIVVQRFINDRKWKIIILHGGKVHFPSEVKSSRKRLCGSANNKPSMDEWVKGTKKRKFFICISFWPRVDDSICAWAITTGTIWVFPALSLEYSGSYLKAEEISQLGSYSISIWRTFDDNFIRLKITISDFPNPSICCDKVPTNFITSTKGKETNWSRDP